VIWLEPKKQYTYSGCVDFDHSSFGRQSEVDRFGASTLFVKRAPSEDNMISERFIEQPVIEGGIGRCALAKRDHRRGKRPNETKLTGPLPPAFAK